MRTQRRLTAAQVGARRLSARYDAEAFVHLRRTTARIERFVWVAVAGGEVIDVEHALATSTSVAGYLNMHVVTRRPAITHALMVWMTRWRLMARTR